VTLLDAISFTGGVSSTIMLIVSSSALVFEPVRRYIKSRLRLSRNPEKEIVKDIKHLEDLRLGISKMYKSVVNLDADVLVCIGGGGAIVGGMLAKRLKLPVLSVYKNDDTGWDGNLKSVKGKKVIIVDDAHRSGNSMKQVLALLERHKPESIDCSVLLYIEIHDSKPDYLTAYSYRATKRVKLPWDLWST